MHYVPVFLRPLSQMNTGLESHVEGRAEQVDSIVTESPRVQFEQSDEHEVWRYEEVLQGKEVIEHGRQVKRTEEADVPGRHWFIISEGLLENLDPGLGRHADIFDFILAVNLCIDEPVAFSQSPGQTIGGAYQYRRGALDYRGDLSLGSFPLALSTMNEIPSRVEVADYVGRTFEMVREFRSIAIHSDEDMDIRVGLHKYDDALTSSLWTAISNMFFVCENVLCSGRSVDPVTRISEVTEMDSEDARNWKSAVNRLKHPDKGEVPSLHQQTDREIPTLRYMRKTANTALLHAMRDRFNERASNA